MFSPTVLYRAPDTNPISKKARSIPAFNPLNMYGRVFTFSWFGFMIAFLSWYAWSPLITKTIKADLKLSQNDIANSNILALTATLLVRAVAGPLCDMFGPRYVFAGTLLAGAVPTAFAFAVKGPKGLMAIRFFIGILGGSFVPCQVWSTGFFDKNIVGTANALTGGFGNSGGGITYFVMPLIFDSFVGDLGMTPHKAWRMSFFVPFSIIVVTAIGMLLFCDDTPVGPWATRHERVAANLQAEHAAGHIIPASGIEAPRETLAASTGDELKKAENDSGSDVEQGVGQVVEVDAAYTHEVVAKPSLKDIVKITISPQTLVLMACYWNSFGSELAINSILGAYYIKNLHMSQTLSGRWASMFGLLNVACRPLGGIVGDIIYKYTNGNLWAKKAWIHYLGIVMGVFMLAIGLTDPHNMSTMVGLVAGLAIHMDAQNGANFALVPHVHPQANGIVSGMIGATGNLGGVVGAIIFRYNGTHYARSIWILGAIAIAMNVAGAWVRPIPKGQIGGR